MVIGKDLDEGEARVVGSKGEEDDVDEGGLMVWVCEDNRRVRLRSRKVGLMIGNKD